MSHFKRTFAEMCYSRFFWKYITKLILSKVASLKTGTYWQTTQLWVFSQKFGKVFRNSYHAKHLCAAAHLHHRFCQLILTLLCESSLSYGNQSIDFNCESVDWFLYDMDLCRKRVKNKIIPSLDLLVQIQS